MTPPPTPTRSAGPHRQLLALLGRSSVKLGTPWAVSLALHITLVSIIAFVALRAALEPPLPEQRSIEFDDTGALLPMQAAPARAETSVAAPAPRAEPSIPSPVAIPAPLAAVPSAPESPAAAAAPVPEAWLAPASLSPSAAPRDPADPGADVVPQTPGGDVKFAGLGSSNARSVVYVVDASGPMVSTFREVMDELDRSVSRLSASQRFGVVVFRRQSPGQEFDSFMPVLVRATPNAKRELRQWLAAITPAGGSNPLSGLRAALKLKPDALFLLSRGIERSGGGLWELGLDATMAELDRLNPVDERNGRRRVVIKTIQFIDEDPTGTMQQIGRIHGQTVSTIGTVQRGYRVIHRGSELTEEPTLEPDP